MAKKTDKVVGNSFEDLKLEEMAKTQGAGDTEAETATILLSTIIVSASIISATDPRNH